MPAAKQVTVGPDKPREKVDVAMVQIPNLTGYWDFYYAPAGSQQEQGPLWSPHPPEGRTGMDVLAESGTLTIISYDDANGIEGKFKATFPEGYEIEDYFKVNFVEGF